MTALSRTMACGIAAAGLMTAACDTDRQAPLAPDEHGLAMTQIGVDPEVTFAAAIFDIAAAPDGSIVLAENTTVKRARGSDVQTVATVPTAGSPVNGIVAMGAGTYYVTSGGLDQALGAGVWRVTPAGARLVGDIEAYEKASDPDATAGPAWKNVLCEDDGVQFTAGPQSNPYHLTAVSGDEVLVADAAGNSLLSVRNNGAIELVAVFTPPVDGSGDYRVLFPLDADTDCYVQPVPTSVAVAPDGTMYVGELTGAPAVPGWSRIWEIDAGSRDVVCPSAACRVLVDGFTSVIDVAFGPDGMLYVVELDANGWLTMFGVGAPAGGNVHRCDVAIGACGLVEGGLTFPGAITFTKDGTLWVLENSLGTPTVSSLGTF